MFPPDKEPIIVRPKTPRAKNSGFAKEKISGFKIGIETARATAPNTPPKADTVNAAPNALSASPFIANG